MKKRDLKAISCFLIFGFTLLGTSSSKATEPKGYGYGYWNKARLDSSMPIELVVDKKTSIGKIVTRTKGVTVGSPSVSSNGSNWTQGGDPLTFAGKVFFTVGTQNYVCSGAFVNDALIGKAIVQTAGHCAWDQAGQAFVTNFVFIPSYQSNQAVSCAATPELCYLGEKFFVRNDFASQTSFNSTALSNDWAYVVVDRDAPGSFPISFTKNYSTGNVSSFGYPAVFPYNGNLLIDCLNPIFRDSKNANRTWGMSCNMTGGASGGPWLYPWDGTAKTGTLFSLNSYKYASDKSKMYGPMFNQDTADTYNSANGATTPIAGVRAS